MLKRLRSLSQFFSIYWQHLPLAKDAFFSLRCEYYLIKGELRTGGAVVTVLYAGRGKNKDYLLEYAFSKYDILKHDEGNLLQFDRCLLSLEGLADVTINDIGWPYSLLYTKREQYLEVPDWINMGVDLADSWPEVIKTFRRTTRNSDLRLIRRNDYRPEFTTDSAEVNDFYDNYYLPFALHSHGAAALIASKNEVMKRARNGGLLKIKAGTETVAAGVLLTEKDVLCFLWLGIPQAQLQAPAEAAISALYYFGIKHAFDNQCRAVDFTGSRAFLNDGGYHFKRKWGAIAEDTDSPSAILIKPQQGNSQAVAFCEAVPLLARVDGKLIARVVTRTKDFDQSTVDRYLKELTCPGIETLSIIQLDDSCSRRSLPSRTNAHEIEHIAVDLEHFSKVYVNGG